MQNVGQAPAAGGPTRSVLLNLWRFRVLVVAATLAGGLIGWGLSQLQSERYEASAEMLLTDPRDAGLFRDVTLRQGDPVRYLRNQAQRVTSSAVAERTAQLLDEPLTVTEVRERVRAVPSSDLDLITIIASAPTGEAAAALANAVVQAYQETVTSEVAASTEETANELRSSLEQVQARVSETQQRLQASPGDDVAALQLDADVRELLATQQLLERLTIDASLYGSGVETVEPAVEPDKPVVPRTLANALVAALLGFGAMAAVIVRRADAMRRVDQRHEPQEVLGVPLLGAISDFGKLSEDAAYPTVSDPDSPSAEAFRFAAAAIEARLGRDVHTIVVTSAGAGDGKTTITINLGVALRQETRKVLLLDADTRVRGLSRLTGTEGLRGLTDVAEGDCSLSEAIHDSREGALFPVPITPVGQRLVDSAAFFRTVRYRSLLNRLRQENYLSVVDAPPLLAVSDASAIAGSADAIVLVVTRGTPVRLLADLKERLSFVGTPVLGYIFNRASDRRQSYGYGYGYGYGQHLATADEGAAPREATWGDIGVVPPIPDVPSAGGGNGSTGGVREGPRARGSRRR